MANWQPKSLKYEVNMMGQSSELYDAIRMASSFNFGTCRIFVKSLIWHACVAIYTQSQKFSATNFLAIFSEQGYVMLINLIKKIMHNKGIIYSETIMLFY